MTQKELERDFNRKTIKALASQGAKIYDRTWLPGKDGSYANGETGYKIDHNGTSKIMNYLQVLEMAGV